MNKTFFIIYIPYLLYTFATFVYTEVFVYAHLLIFINQTVRTMYSTYRIIKYSKYNPAFVDVRNNHVFIIPMYMTSLQDINHTIAFLACHSCCNKYTVVIALDESDSGSLEKAIILVNQYKIKFAKIMYTVHTRHLNEIPEIIATINSAIRTIGLNLSDDDIVTIMQHDMLIPEKYVVELDIRSNDTDIFLAPTMYDHNTSETPIHVCIQDYLTAMYRMHISLPMHVYSMRAGLIKKIGYWDTTNDAISHGIHMFLKARVCDSNTNAVMIHVPVNVKHNINKTYTDTVKYYFGMLDIAYIYNYVLPRNGNVIDGAFLVLQMYQVYLFFIVNTQTLIMFRQHFLLHAITFGLLLTRIMCYELVRHLTSNALFNRPARFKVTHSFFYPIIMWFNGITYTFLPFFHVMLLIIQNRDSL